MDRSDSRPQIAVWYFIGATFVFASTTPFFDDPEPWLRVVTLVVGFGLVVAGGFQFAREVKARPRDDAD